MKIIYAANAIFVMILWIVMATISFKKIKSPILRLNFY